MLKTSSRARLALNLLLPYLMATLVASWAATSSAATLYKWIDENGNVTYQDTPPGDNVQFEESIVDAPPPELPDNAGQQIEDAALENPVSLYTVPACDSCDLVRLFLERNAIPFAEKDVRTNIELQDELEQKIGALTVPTLTIGDTVLDGYSRAAITAALTEAGFPVGQQAGSTPGGESLEPTDTIDSSEPVFPELEPLDSSDQEPVSEISIESN